MKFAVISDIHGNMEALSATLADIKKEDIKNIYICGDLAMAGPEPTKTIDFIKDELPKHFNIKVLQGNTDEMIAKGIFPPDEVMKNSLEYLLQEITPTQKEFLANLPAQIEEEIGGYKYLFVHGSPRKNDEYIMPDKPIEEVQEMIKCTDADFIFCGHTHLPAGYQINNQTLVNVGSVGRTRSDKGLACYCIVDATDGVELEHKFVPFDTKSASEKLAKLPFRGAKELADFLLN